MHPFKIFSLLSCVNLSFAVYRNVVMLVINFTNHIIFSFTESTDSVSCFTSLLYRIGNSELATLLSYVFIHTIILRYKHMFLTNVCVVFFRVLASGFSETCLENGDYNSSSKT